MLTEALKKQIQALQKLYPERRSALIPALHLVQSVLGYLPPEAQKEVAELFAIDPNEVQGIVTFYDMFFESPPGKHLLHVCKNASCMLRGSDQLIETLCQKLQVSPREVTGDGEFSIIPSECLGACDRAPVLLVDDKIVGPVPLEEIDQILTEARKKQGRDSPVEELEVEHG